MMRTASEIRDLNLFAPNRRPWSPCLSPGGLCHETSYSSSRIKEGSQQRKEVLSRFSMGLESQVITDAAPCRGALTDRSKRGSNIGRYNPLAMGMSQCITKGVEIGNLFLQCAPHRAFQLVDFVMRIV